jgi:Holliday junction resolvasome RuvABC endonuclease subunit
VTQVVLGVDPQPTRLGLALVTFEAPHRAIWAATDSIDRPDCGWRFEQVRDSLHSVDGICAQGGFEVCRIGIEQPPWVNNVSRFREIVKVQEAVEEACRARWRHAPQIMRDAGTWKKDVLGKGNAHKAEVMFWAASRAPFEVDSQDSADALAIAVSAAMVELVEAA